MTVTLAAARKLDKQLRGLLDDMEAFAIELGEKLREAKESKLWKDLGFKSWGAYIADLCEGRLHLGITARKELVWTLYDEGMSQRDIADTVGTAKGTVQNDLAHRGGQKCPPATAGHDGKTYPRKQPTKKQETKAQQEADLVNAVSRIFTPGRVQRLSRKATRLFIRRLEDALVLLREHEEELNVKH